MPDRPPNFRKGELPSSRKFNTVSAVLRAANLVVLWPLTLFRGSKGTVVGLDASALSAALSKIDAQLTSTIAGDLSYNWKRVVRTTGHAWADASPSVTGKAWELNNTNTLPIGFRVEILLDAGSGDWLFQMDKC